MGSMFSGLTKEDIADIQNTGCAFSPEEIKVLYKRFRELDKEEIGRVYTDRILCIPEISINPLGERVVRQICAEDGALDFRGFLKIIGIFSTKSTNKEKLEFFIKVISSNGKITKKDLEEISTDIYAGMYNKEEISKAIEEVFQMYGEKKKECIEYSDLEGLDCKSLSVI